MILPPGAMDAADRALLDRVRAALPAVAIPERAPAMQAYMKSTLPFLGVPKPALQATLRALYAAWHPPDAPTWRATVLALFRGATHREEWYAALQLLGTRRFLRWLDPDALDLCETLVVEGAWWDVVDEIAAHRLRHLLEHYPEAVRPVLWSWATDPDLWRRRAAILCQLHRRLDTDRALLTHAIDENLADRAFFIRKAIGWALRDLADHDPAWVRAFVAARDGRMAPLSAREALRKVDAGAVARA